jgi:hypothetical protein
MARITHPHALRPKVLLCLLAVVAVASLPVAAVTSANAAVWEDVTCSLDGHVASTEGWTPRFLGTPSSGASETNTCSSPGGALTASDQSRGETQSNGSGAEWDYAAPKGEPIAGGAITFAVYGGYGQAWLSMPEAVAGEGTTLLVSCFYSVSCSQDGEVPITKHGAEAVYAGAVCIGNPETNECRQTGGLDAEVSVSSAKFLLSDSSRPTATEVAGSILEGAASGTASLSFLVRDEEGPGVYGVVVKIDGDPIYDGTPNLNEGRCVTVGTAPEGSRQFEATQPCPQSVPVSVQVPTSSLGNGLHALTIEAEDAAGTTAVVYSSTITVANHLAASAPDLTPPTPAPSRGPANGTPASEQARLTTEWTSTKTKHTPSAHLATTYGNRQAVAGKLVSSAGASIAGATIEVSETASSVGATARPLTVAHTGADGRFTATLPPSLTSATITFAYRSHLGDPSPAATALLTVTMPATITLNVIPRITRQHHKITLSGRLSGPIPPGGKQVVIEAREHGGTWVEFTDPDSKANGKFEASHRFKYAGPALYEFRAVCKHEADFPFSEGKSSIVSVWER